MTTLGNSVSSGGIFLILLALAGVVLALVLAAVYVIRLMAVVLLAAAAPLCLALYALPQTAWAARWWWRALTAALAIQVAQGLVMTAAVQVFFSPGWLPGDISSTLGQTLITLCLLYILMRIPFWVARPVLSPFGRSPLRRAARFAVTAAIFSRIAPLLRPGTPGQGRQGAARAARPAATERKHAVSYEVPDSVPIPSDVERPDKILAGLTARQVAIAAVAAVVIWAGFQATRHVMPLPAFAALASPVGLAAAALVIGRAGRPDRWTGCCWPPGGSGAPRAAWSPPPRASRPRPPGPPRPARQPPPPAVLAPLWRHIAPDGVIGLGSAGAAAVAAVSTVNFALRSPGRAGRPRRRLRPVAELASPARCRSWSGPGGPTCPPPSRRCATPPRACRTRPWSRPRWSTPRSWRAWPPSGTCSPARRCSSSASPATGPAGPAAPPPGAPLQRAGEAARLLAGAGLQVQVLDGGQVTALLAACADPAAPPRPAGRAALPGRPVTSAGRPA